MDGLPFLELLDLLEIFFIFYRTGKFVNGEDKDHKSHNKIDAVKDNDSVL